MSCSWMRERERLRVCETDGERERQVCVCVCFRGSRRSKVRQVLNILK